jgi:hypothetical protein
LHKSKNCHANGVVPLSPICYGLYVTLQPMAQRRAATCPCVSLFFFLSRASIFDTIIQHSYIYHKI